MARRLPTRAAAAPPRSTPAAAGPADRADRRAAAARGGTARRRWRDSGSERSSGRSAAPPTPAWIAVRRPALRACRIRRLPAAHASPAPARVPRARTAAALPGAAASRPATRRAAARRREALYADQSWWKPSHQPAARAQRERAWRASHANGARRRSGARERVWGSPRGEAPRIRLDAISPGPRGDGTL